MVYEYDAFYNIENKCSHTNGALLCIYFVAAEGSPAGYQDAREPYSRKLKRWAVGRAVMGLKQRYDYDDYCIILFDVITSAQHRLSNHTELAI